MVTKYGMSSRLGTITYGSGQEEVFLGRDFAQSKEYSEQTAAIIDSETKEVLYPGFHRVDITPIELTGESFAGQTSTHFPQRIHGKLSSSLDFFIIKTQFKL